MVDLLAVRKENQVDLGVVRNVAIADRRTMMNQHCAIDPHMAGVIALTFPVGLLIKGALRSGHQAALRTEEGELPMHVAVRSGYQADLHTEEEATADIVGRTSNLAGCIALMTP